MFAASPIVRRPLLHFLQGTVTALVLLIVFIMQTGVAWAIPPEPHLVADIYDISDSSHPSQFFAINQHICFFADDGVHGNELWCALEGDQPPVLTADLNPGAGASDLYEAQSNEDLLYFIVNSLNGSGLWRTDGTSGGTIRLTDPNDIVIGGKIPMKHLAVGSRRTFFFMDRDTEPLTLWTTSGEPGDTRKINTFAPDSPRDLGPTIVVQNRLYFALRTNDGMALWKSDGADGDATIVYQHEPGANLKEFTAFNDLLLYRVEDFNGISQLWRSDGTQNGTFMLQQFGGTWYSDHYDFQTIGKKSYFQALHPDYGQELWVTDGSVAGTQLVSDHTPGVASSDIRNMTLFQGMLYFTYVNSDTLADEVWRIDTNDTGPTLLGTGPAPIIGQMWASDVQLFFTAEAETYGNELWVGDGLLENVTLLKDIWPGQGSSNAAGFTQAGATVYFTADDGKHGQEMWQTDGSAQGTGLLYDINPFTIGPDEYTQVSVVAPMASDLFVIAPDGLVDGVVSEDLWRTGGAAGSTRLIADTSIGRIGSIVSGGYLYLPGYSEFWRSNGEPDGMLKLGDIRAKDLTDVNGTAFFTADTWSDGYGLWKSNGSIETTTFIKTIGDFSSQGKPIKPVSMGGKLYFIGYDSEHGYELWRSDGTEAGTHLVKDIWPGPSSGLHEYGLNYSELFVYNGYLYFGAHTADGLGLWRSDGTEGGTQLIQSFGSDSPPGEADRLISFTVTNGVAFFFLKSGEYGRPFLWSDHGSPGNAQPLMQVYAFNDELDAAAMNGKLYFSHGEIEFGSELWVSDGTVQGTSILKDIETGESSSYPAHLTVANGRLYFSAYTQPFGSELWWSDGSAAGTELVSDIHPGPVGSDPNQLTVADYRLYFVANDGVTGRELWTLLIDTPNLPPRAFLPAVFGSQTH